jgi:hypothetical protein
MRRRHLARHDELQPRIQRLRDARLATQRRVLENQYAPLGFLGRDQLAGFHHLLAQFGVVPEVRHRG